MMWFSKHDLGLMVCTEVNESDEKINFESTREEFLCQEQETHLQLL